MNLQNNLHQTYKFLHLLDKCYQAYINNEVDTDKYIHKMAILESYALCIVDFLNQKIINERLALLNHFIF